MWFTETPWPPILILSVGTVLCLILWHAQRRAVWLTAAAGTIVLAGGIWLVERAVVTPREKVEAAVVGITSAFERGDRERTLAYISSRAETLRRLAATALERVDVRGLRVTDVRVSLHADNSRARSHFRANGSVSYRGRDLGQRPSRWEVTWQREAGRWRMTRVQRLHPISGEPMGVWEQLRR